MARQVDGGKLVIASHNQGKVREIGDLLRPFGVDVVSAGDLGLPEPDETGYTFTANALLKAKAAADAAQLPALADDSGLAVAALDGAPGIYSARWGGKNKNFDLAMNRVHRALKDKTDKSATFVCALALAWPDGHSEVFEGTVSGEIVEPGRGDQGFGYDPIFVPAQGLEKGDTRTFGEMDPDEKHGISHRADAFKKLVEACFTK